MKFIITSTVDHGKPAAEEPEAMTDELFMKYMKFNEELHRAGVLVAAEGLTPGTPGARIVASGGRRNVVDGPFAESKELVGGFYVIDVPSFEDAKAWALRCPVGMRSADVLEVRQLTDMSEIPARYIDLAKQAAPTWVASQLAPRSKS
ncbi:MAG TPA: YciI family protein [Polyangia bacterium]|jgi:hypothetical protein|nr:YciI family protein [Polyangia bacterium]